MAQGRKTQHFFLRHHMAWNVGQYGEAPELPMPVDTRAEILFDDEARYRTGKKEPVLTLQTTERVYLDLTLLKKIVALMEAPAVESE